MECKESEDDSLQRAWHGWKVWTGGTTKCRSFVYAKWTVRLNWIVNFPQGCVNPFELCLVCKVRTGKLMLHNLPTSNCVWTVVLMLLMMLPQQKKKKKCFRHLPQLAPHQHLWTSHWLPMVSVLVQVNPRNCMLILQAGWLFLFERSLSQPHWILCFLF